MVSFLIVAVILGGAILINYNSDDSKIRRASNAASSVWDAASPDKRRRLLESAGVAGVPKEKYDELVSNSWQSLNGYVRDCLTSLHVRTKNNYDSQDASLSIIEGKDSAIIPEPNTKFAKLANSVAQQIVAVFNKKTLDEILIAQHHIENDFNPKWSYQDALSRSHLINGWRA